MSVPVRLLLNTYLVLFQKSIRPVHIKSLPETDNLRKCWPRIRQANASAAVTSLVSPTVQTEIATLNSIQ